MELNIELSARLDRRPHRIAVGSIFTESNHLGGLPTEMEAFERYQLLRGQEVLDLQEGYVGGILEGLKSEDCEIVPLLVASACPGGPISARCYLELKEELLEALRQAGPVDGVALSLHGAAAAECCEDVDGDLLMAARELVGGSAAVVASLDLHAHVTMDMVRAADALIALETYPHRDARETGSRAARMLLDILNGDLSPVMVMAKVPVLTSAVNASTDDQSPFAELMRFAKEHEGTNNVVSASVFLVHPYLDTEDMGAGGLVITNGDYSSAHALAAEIAERYWERRFEFEPVTYSPLEAVERGLAVRGGPVLLVETSDCCGGGAAGDSIVALRALLESGVPQLSLAPVVDPDAAEACHRAGVGTSITLQLGHSLDPRWGQPLEVTGKVVHLSDGNFTYSGGMWQGTHGSMGRSAVLKVGAVRVLIATKATYDWADEQYLSMGLRADEAKFVVVKNPMNYRQGYSRIAKAAFILDTPGPTPATLKGVNFSRVKRPYYPRDLEISGLEPRILSRLAPDLSGADLARVR